MVRELCAAGLVHQRGCVPLEEIKRLCGVPIYYVISVLYRQKRAVEVKGDYACPPPAFKAAKAAEPAAPRAEAGPEPAPGAPDLEPDERCVLDYLRSRGGCAGVDEILKACGGAGATRHGTVGRRLWRKKKLVNVRDGGRTVCLRG